MSFAVSFWRIVNWPGNPLWARCSSESSSCNARLEDVVHGPVRLQPCRHSIVFFDSEFPQVRYSRTRPVPLLSVTHPDATTDPIVEACARRLKRDQMTITHPTLKVAPQLCEPMSHQNAAIATIHLFHAFTKSAFNLRADWKLSARSSESKPSPVAFIESQGDSFCLAGAAFLLIDFQLQFASQDDEFTACEDSVSGIDADSNRLAADSPTDRLNAAVEQH